MFRNIPRRHPIGELMIISVADTSIDLANKVPLEISCGSCGLAFYRYVHYLVDAAHRAFIAEEVKKRRDRIYHVAALFRGYYVEPIDHFRGTGDRLGGGAFNGVGLATRRRKARGLSACFVSHQQRAKRGEVAPVPLVYTTGYLGLSSDTTSEARRVLSRWLERDRRHAIS